MLLTLLPRLAPVILGGALRIQSEVACPDAAEVSVNVQKLLDLSDQSAATLQGATRRDESWLVLSLWESDGKSLGERRVPYDGDCATLARAAAVVFSAWISNEHPEFLVALPAEGAEPNANGASAVEPAPGAGPSSPAPINVEPRRPAPTPGRSAPAPGAAPPPAVAKRRLVLSAGIGGAANSNSFAPGVTLNAAWDPGRHGWGARVGVTWLGARSEPLDGREVSWTRWPLTAGPFLRLPAARASFDLEAGGALGWARLHGRGFATDTTDSGMTAGGYAALRFVPNDARLHLFVMAAPLSWCHNATAIATDATGAAVASDLPAWEVLLTLGAELPL